MKVYGIMEAAKELNRSEASIKDYVEAHKIMFQQIGRKGTIVFTQDDIDEYLKRRKLIEEAKKPVNIK